MYLGRKIATNRALRHYSALAAEAAHEVDAARSAEAAEILRAHGLDVELPHGLGLRRPELSNTLDKLDTPAFGAAWLAAMLGGAA